MACRVSTGSAALSKCSLLLAFLVLLHQPVGSQAERPSRAHHGNSGVAELQLDSDGKDVDACDQMANTVKPLIGNAKTQVQQTQRHIVIAGHVAKLFTKCTVDEALGIACEIARHFEITETMDKALEKLRKPKVCDNSKSITYLQVLEQNVKKQYSGLYKSDDFRTAFDFVCGDCSDPLFPGLETFSEYGLIEMLQWVQERLSATANLAGGEVEVFIGPAGADPGPATVKVTLKNNNNNEEKLCNGGRECFFPLQYPSKYGADRLILNMILAWRSVLQQHVRLVNCICWTCFPAFFFLAKQDVEVTRCQDNQGSGAIFNAAGGVGEARKKFAETCKLNR